MTDTTAPRTAAGRQNRTENGTLLASVPCPPLSKRERAQRLRREREGLARRVVAPCTDSGRQLLDLMVGVNRDLGDVPEAEHRAIWAENITNVEAEAIEPLLALVRAAQEFFEPVASPHPKYRQPAQDGHRPGSWPSDECERCRDQHAAKVHALRDAVSALDPAIVAAARKP